MSDHGARYLRGLSPVLGMVAVWLALTGGTAHAADDDDDDDNSWTDISTSTPGSGIEMWPPTLIGWPPLVPDDEGAVAAIVPVGPPPGQVPAPAPGESLPPLPIVPAHN